VKSKLGFAALLTRNAERGGGIGNQPFGLDFLATVITPAVGAVQQPVLGVDNVAQLMFQLFAMVPADRFASLVRRPALVDRVTVGEDYRSIVANLPADLLFFALQQFP